MTAKELLLKSLSLAVIIIFLFFCGWLSESKIFLAVLWTSVFWLIIWIVYTYFERKLNIKLLEERVEELREASKELDNEINLPLKEKILKGDTLGDKMFRNVYYGVENEKKEIPPIYNNIVFTVIDRAQRMNEMTPLQTLKLCCIELNEELNEKLNQEIKKK